MSNATALERSQSPEEISEGIYKATWNATTHPIPERELLALTALLDQCPDWWEWPCMCASCRSHL